MSAATVALFRARLERRAAGLAGDLRSAILKAYDLLASNLTDAELTGLIETGNLDAIVTDADARLALRTLQTRIRDGVESAAKAMLREGFPGVAFDTLSPSVIRGIQTLNDRALQTLSTEVRETVRHVVEQGLRDGVGVRTIARNLRDVIGLAPNQTDAVANFRRMLEEGDAEALTRQLRDRRFDGTLRRAFAGDGLGPKQIDSMVSAYQRRFVAFNAETNARTVAMDAQKLGQHLAYADAVSRGDMNGATLTKRWSGTLDDRERDTHLAMEGETVPWDAYYSNGQMQPGDGEYNCRCVSIYSTIETIKPGAGAFGAFENLQAYAGARTRT